MGPGINRFYDSSISEVPSISKDFAADVLSRLGTSFPFDPGSEELLGHGRRL